MVVFCLLRVFSSSGLFISGMAGEVVFSLMVQILTLFVLFHFFFVCMSKLAENSCSDIDGWWGELEL